MVRSLDAILKAVDSGGVFAKEIRGLCGEAVPSSSISRSLKSGVVGWGDLAKLAIESGSAYTRWKPSIDEPFSKESSKLFTLRYTGEQRGEDFVVRVTSHEYCKNVKVKLSVIVCNQKGDLPDEHDLTIGEKVIHPGESREVSLCAIRAETVKRVDPGETFRLTPGLFDEDDNKRETRHETCLKIPTLVNVQTKDEFSGKMYGPHMEQDYIPLARHPCLLILTAYSEREFTWKPYLVAHPERGNKPEEVVAYRSKNVTWPPNPAPASHRKIAP